MNQKHITDQLAAYIGGELDEPTRAIVRVHLDECESCRAEFASLNKLWNELGSLPNPVPDPEMNARFDDMLTSYEYALQAEGALPESAKPTMFRAAFGRPAFQFAVAAVLLFAGAFAGYYLRAESTTGVQLAQLHDEIQSTNRMLTVSLLREQSASERLEGVSWSYKSEQDPVITNALVEAVKYDDNVNVRLAALDALAKSANQQSVREELAKDLSNQTSPLVQIAIIDLLVQQRDKHSVDMLQRMLQSPEINPVVKKRIEQGLQQLS
jgi:hypothetical protein